MRSTRATAAVERLTARSGNEAFDGRVRAAMEMHVGQSVPPPPPNYPQLLEPTVHLTFQGKNEKCK